MKLDLFERLFRHKEKDEEIPSIIDVDSLRKLLRDRLENGRAEILKECKPIIEEIEEGIRIIESIANDISKSEIPEEIPMKAYKVVKTSRPAFVNGVLDAIKPLKNRDVFDYKDLEEFYRDLEDSLSYIAKISISKGRHLPIAFGEEVESIRRESKNLLEKSKILKGKLEKSNTGKVVTLLNKLDDIDRYKNELKVLEDNKKELLRKIDNLKSKKKDLEGRIKSISDAREFQELRSYEGELKEIKEDISRIETRIFNSLNPLSRVLRKFRRYAEKSMEKELTRIIDAYLNDPVDALLSDEKGVIDNIDNILNNIEDSIKTGKMEMKKKDIEKILKKISVAKGLDKEGIRKRYHELKSREDKILEEIERLSPSIDTEGINREIEKIEREIIRKTNEMEKQEKMIKHLKEGIEKTRKEISKNLNEIEGRNIRIKW